VTNASNVELTSKASRNEDGTEARGDSPGQEVPQVDKLAMPLVLDVHDTVSVLPSSNRLPVDDNVRLGSNDGEGNHFLWYGQHENGKGSQLEKKERMEVEGERFGKSRERSRTYPNSSVKSLLLLVVLVSIDRVESNLMVGELSSNLVPIANRPKGFKSAREFEGEEMKTKGGRREGKRKLTLSLKAALSSSVNESDLAMTGTTLTTSESFLRTMRSI